MAKKKIIIIGRGGGQNQDIPTDITELQQQIQRLTAERNALSLQLSAATAELEQANADVTTLTSEKEALQESVDELNTQISKLDEQIQKLTAERNALSFQLSAVTAELEQANADVTTLTAERNALSLQLGVVQGELEQANANVDSLTSEKEALSLQLGVVQGELEQANADVTTLTSEKEALSLQLGVVQGELEQANADVTTLTSEKEALQESVDELNNQIAALNTRIEQLEETIKNMGGDVPGGEIIPGGPHNPENDAFEEDFLWIENVDDTDSTITLNLKQAPFMYYSYDDDTEFQKMVSTSSLSIPAHSKIYLRWKGKITCSTDSPFIFGPNCNHNIGGELKNGGLKSNVYEYFFCNNTKLIDASELKLTATKLATYCYQYMFRDCTSLTTAPELPATTLASNCYQYMFSGCTSLTTAPELPATTLASNCCRYMFNGCTSLTSAPELPATTLAEYCYCGMFQSCKSLTTAPELPATTLKGNCYSNMFNICTSLTSAPELPATKLEYECYRNMFNGCTSLNYVKTNVVSWSTSDTSGWLQNVAPNGVVDVLPGSTITENSISGVPSGWTKQIDPSTKNIINIHNVSGLENTISIPNKYSAFKYKTNNDAEYKENPKTTTLTIKLQADETLTIVGIYYPSTSNSSFTGITSTENINVSGEVNYLIPYMFNSLFNNSTKLIDASQLKLSTTLADYCYSYMFSGCTSLTTAPELPATTLANYCYQHMFNGCSNLTTAPELPATTLKSNCYREMFNACKSLTTAPELPATTLARSCYNYMFYNCTSLTTAPELPATTLVSNCYEHMFELCTKLNSLTFLSTEPFIYNDNGAKTNWLGNVSSTGTFRTPIENKEWLDTYPRSEHAVPSGWTIEYI